MTTYKDINQISFDNGNTIYNLHDSTYVVDSSLNSTSSNPVQNSTLYDMFYYKSGDSIVDTSFNIITGGLVTSSATSIQFSIPFTKRLTNVTPSITKLVLTIRATSGQYILTESNILANSNFKSLTLGKCPCSENILYIAITGNSAWSNATNNTPVAIAIWNTSVSFS